jgi:hypothetical protein
MDRILSVQGVPPDFYQFIKELQSNYLLDAYYKIKLS